jgi:hypothetical protein
MFPFPWLKLTVGPGVTHAARRLGVGSRTELRRRRANRAPAHGRLRRRRRITRVVGGGEAKIRHGIGMGSAEVRAMAPRRHDAFARMYRLFVAMGVASAVSAAGDARAEDAPPEVGPTPGSPDEILERAETYADLAERGGDPWDALMALIYYERFVEHAPSRDSEYAPRMKRLRQLAGRAPIARPGRAYPVEFLAYAPEEGSYVVKTEGQRCATPCSLELPSGAHVVTASGVGDVETTITVAAGRSAMRLQHDTSRTRRIVGAVLIPSGIVIASTFWVFGFDPPAGTNDRGSWFDANVTAWPLLGTTILVTGIVLAAAPHKLPDDVNRIQVIGLAPLMAPTSVNGLKLAGAVSALRMAF